MRTATAVVAIFLVMLFSLELLNSSGNSAGTSAQVPQVLSETTATDASLLRDTEAGSAADTEAGSAADTEQPAAEPEIMNDGAGAAEEAVAEVEEAAAADEPMEEALTTSQAESEIITDTVEPAGETAPAPYPAPVTDGYAYNGVITMPTQQLTPTGTIERGTTSGGDEDLGLPPTPADDTDRPDSTPSTLRVLQIGLGLLFFVLLGGTWLLRRQL
jgi:hypothetical protein